MREEARERIEDARRTAQETLIAVAGPQYSTLVRMVEEFQEAESRAAGEGEPVLARISAFLESDDADGEVVAIIERAKGYESEIESTLGNDLKRFASVLPAYLKHPELVVKRRWMAAYASVLSQDDTEIYYVPSGLGSLLVTISGLEDIQEIRNRLRLDEKRKAALLDFAKGFGGFTRRADTFGLGESVPMLEAKDGRIRARDTGSRRRP